MILRNISRTKELTENELAPQYPQQHQRKFQIYVYYFYDHSFFFFLIFKSSIAPLIFTFITYYYFAKKKDPIF